MYFLHVSKVYNCDQVEFSCKDERTNLQKATNPTQFSAHRNNKTPKIIRQKQKNQLFDDRQSFITQTECMSINEMKLLERET